MPIQILTLKRRLAIFLGLMVSLSAALYAGLNLDEQSGWHRDDLRKLNREMTTDIKFPESMNAKQSLEDMSARQEWHMRRFKACTDLSKRPVQELQVGVEGLEALLTHPHSYGHERQCALLALGRLRRSIPSVEKAAQALLKNPGGLSAWNTGWAEFGNRWAAALYLAAIGNRSEEVLSTLAEASVTTYANSMGPLRVGFGDHAFAALKSFNLADLEPRLNKAIAALPRISGTSWGLPPQEGLGWGICADSHILYAKRAVLHGNREQTRREVPAFLAALPSTRFDHAPFYLKSAKPAPVLHWENCYSTNPDRPKECAEKCARAKHLQGVLSIEDGNNKERWCVVYYYREDENGFFCVPQTAANRK